MGGTDHKSPRPKTGDPSPGAWAAALPRRRGDRPPLRHRPVVVVGVDGCARNRAAVLWGAREAKDAGMGLLLVAVAPRTEVGSHHLPAAAQERTRLRTALVEERVRRRDASPDVAFRLVSGSPGLELVRLARPGDVVVVGKRGAGSLDRVRAGSTSLSAATFTRVPLVVVPDGWDGGAGGHIVVGADGSGRRGKDGPALDFAFARAARLGAPLLVLSGRELPPLDAWSAGDRANWAQECEIRLEALLRVWRHRYPEVQVGVRAETTAPAKGLLKAAEGAQLLVVGRGTRRGPLERLSLGSTARRVLQGAGCPVAVAPLVPATFSPEDALNHNRQEFVA